MIIRRKLRGDTLIEVLLAFTILSAVIGTAFSGAMGSYRSAVSAQNRTQALFLAQYEVDGLKSYRDSLEWTSTNNVSFLDGIPATPGFSVPNSDTIVAASSFVNNGKAFCVGTQDSSSPKITTFWKIINDSSTCNNLAKSLAPNLKDVKMKITMSNSNNLSDRVEAIAEVSYIPASSINSNYREKVTNSIILVK